MENPLGLAIVPTDQLTDWLPGDDLRCIAKSRYGEIWMVNYTEGTNTHTRPLFVELGGSVTLIADRGGNVVLQTIIRPVCRPDEKITIPITNPEEALGSLGSREFSFPMGYYANQLELAVDTAVREASEETGLKPADIIKKIPLGEAFPNGFHPRSNDFFALIVDRQVALQIPASAKLREALENVEWVGEARINQLIADGIIRDQQTMVCWAKYQAKRKIYPELFG